MSIRFLMNHFGHARLLSAGGVEVDLNPQLVLFQLVLLAVACVALKPLLFDPLLALFEERDRRVEGARVEARRMDDEAAELLRKYELEIAQVRRSATEDRDRVRVEAQKLEASMLAEARSEVTVVLDQGRKQLGQEIRSLERTLDQSTPALAREIASRVLGQEVV